MIYNSMRRISIWTWNKWSDCY